MSVKEYKEYSYILIKLWIDNLITDGEYNRIMDRVNEVWRKTGGSSDDNSTMDHSNSGDYQDDRADHAAEIDSEGHGSEG